MLMATGVVKLTDVRPMVAQVMHEVEYARALSDRGLAYAVVTRKRALDRKPDSWQRKMRLEVAEREIERRGLS